ncbi:MAG: hypothetical protein LBQ60_14940 [Bacteroidales bacterium]|nr:hypothetical protein [Bacteroidales bacterium]
MRKRKQTKEKSANKHALISIGKQYDILRLSCIIHVQPNCQYLFNDIFHDTIIYVSCENLQEPEITDEKLLRHFVYRFKMIAFQTIKNLQQKKETAYADNKQTEKEEEQ